MSLERDLMDLEESLMRNDDCVHQSDYYTIVGLANDAREIEQERDRLEAQNAKLRDLIFDMLVDEERGSTEENTYYEHVRLAKDLGIEVE